MKQNVTKIEQVEYPLVVGNKTMCHARKLPIWLCWPTSQRTMPAILVYSLANQLLYTYGGKNLKFSYFPGEEQVTLKIKLNSAQQEMELGLSLAKTDFSDLDSLCHPYDLLFYYNSYAYWFRCNRKKTINSAGADWGPHSRVFASLTLCSAPH